MKPPNPSTHFLASQVRWAMGRGLPAQIAEDVVFESYEKAAARFDPSRGRFEAFMQTVVRQRCANWWRRQGATERAHAGLRLVTTDDQTQNEERAFRNQTALIGALDDDERSVFSTWVLQKHLGKGRVTSVEMSASIGLDVREYENAKRRLRDQLQRLLDRFGWSVADVLQGENDVDQTG